MDTPSSWPDQNRESADERALSTRDSRIREQWDKTFDFHRDRAALAEPVDVARDLLTDARNFEAAMYPEQRALLATTLLWNEDEVGHALWVQSTFRAIARVAAEAQRRVAHPGAQPGGAATELAALAFAACGNAIKWAEIADAERDASLIVELKRVRSLVDAAQGAARCKVPHGEDEAELTLDALYVRALLLDLFCRGNLGPRQVEIADSWLWEWCGDYPFVETPDGAVLELDESGPGGLHSVGMSLPSGTRPRYLSLAAMPGHTALVVNGFRRGEIYPGYGCAAEFRVEEHVATLDFLRQFLEATRSHKVRDPRVVREERLEAFVGLPEIVAKAFVLHKSPLAGDGRPARAVPQLAAIDTRFDLPRRFVRMLDESPDGIGVECEDASVDAGALVALQHADSAVPLLCEVVRRTPVSGTTGAKARVGLRILSREPKKLALRQNADGTGTEALYLPGKDASGHFDTLLVSEHDFDLHGTLEARFDDCTFVLRLNRVRYHGRGWHLAGFEVLEETATGTAPAALDYPTIA